MAKQTYRRKVTVLKLANRPKFCCAWSRPGFHHFPLTDWFNKMSFPCLSSHPFFYLARTLAIIWDTFKVWPCTQSLNRRCFKKGLYSSSYSSCTYYLLFLCAFVEVRHLNLYSWATHHWFTGWRLGVILEGIILQCFLLLWCPHRLYVRVFSLFASYLHLQMQ